jgi:hypothetical protein
MHNCHDVNGYFPSAGWGWGWTGEVDRGVGKNQPGGWVYNILPFVEQRPLHDLGKGQTGATQLASYATRNSTAVAIFICPSRRPAIAYPGSATYNNANSTTIYGRTDYAICVSSNNTDEVFYGPPDLASGDSDAWWAANNPGAGNIATYNGIAYTRSQVKILDITKGTSNQVMIGEKYLNPTNYATGTDGGDNECMFTGMDNDVCRNTANPPLKDTTGLTDTYRFGSQHLSGVNFVMGDGSVRTISYTVDPNTFLPMGDIRSTAVFANP